MGYMADVMHLLVYVRILTPDFESGLLQVNEVLRYSVWQYRLVC